MKILHSQQGYTMLITMLILVVFGVLGLSLMTMSLSGTNRSESRESTTQAQRLATKGEEYLLAKIQNELNEGITDGVTPIQYLTILDQVIDNHSCSTSALNSTGTATGEYTACILKAIPLHIENPVNPGDLQYNASNPFNPYQKLVTIQSIGDVESMNKSKTVESIHVIGKNLNLELYEFALSTRNTEDSTEDGEMRLGGALGINGSMYVGKDLITHTDAQYYKKTISSHLPKVKNAGIMTNGTVGNFFNNQVVNKVPISIDLEEINVKEKIETYAETFKVKCSGAITTNCTKQMSVSEAADNSFASAAYAPHLNQNDKIQVEPVQNSHKEVILVGKTCLKSAMFTKDINILYTDDTMPPTDSLVEGSCLANHGIKRQDNNKITISEDGLYTAGNMFIGHSDTYDDSPQKPKLSFKGDFYVNKNLYIINATLKTSQFSAIGDNSPITENQANFYVGGDVYILWGEFINANVNIYAEGDIHFINVSDTALVRDATNKPESFTGRIEITDTNCKLRNYPGTIVPILSSIPQYCKNDFETALNKLEGYNEPSVINGLVYSNSNIIMHTASSNITFTGGVSAKNIDFSTVAGQVISERDKLKIIYNDYDVRVFYENSKIRYSLDPQHNFYVNMGNMDGGWDYLREGLPSLIDIGAESIFPAAGVTYCISPNYTPTLVDWRPLTKCKDENGQEYTKGKHYIVDEYYSFPKPEVQQNFSSRVNFNQPNRQLLLEKIVIHSLDPSKHVERQVN